MVWNKESPATALTGPHRLLHGLLRTMGFTVEDEYPVDKYRLDCYVPEVHMGFEMDGKRIHAGITKQKKDAARDKWIYENAGIPIMRIQHDAAQYTLWGIDPHTKEIADDGLAKLILNFVEEYSNNISERRQVGRWLSE